MVVRSAPFVLVAALALVWVIVATPAPEASHVLSQAVTVPDEEPPVTKVLGFVLEPEMTTTTTEQPDRSLTVDQGLAPAIGPTLEQRIEDGRITLVIPEEVFEVEDPQTLWDRGFIEGGGRDLAVMHRVIACESDGVAEGPFNAIGRSSPDWGRAQINSPTWEEEWDRLVPIPFFAPGRPRPTVSSPDVGGGHGYQDPYWNGWFSAHIQTVQGTSAWVCAKKLGLA